MKTDPKVIDKPVYEVSKDLKSHANDPFVKKKVEKAAWILKQIKNSVEESSSDS